MPTVLCSGQRRPVTASTHAMLCPDMCRHDAGQDLQSAQKHACNCTVAPFQSLCILAYSTCLAQQWQAPALMLSVQMQGTWQWPKHSPPPASIAEAFPCRCGCQSCSCGPACQCSSSSHKACGGCKQAQEAPISQASSDSSSGSCSSQLSQQNEGCQQSPVSCSCSSRDPEASSAQTASPCSSSSSSSAQARSAASPAVQFKPPKCCSSSDRATAQPCPVSTSADVEQAATPSCCSSSPAPSSEGRALMPSRVACRSKGAAFPAQHAVGKQQLPGCSTSASSAGQVAAVHAGTGNAASIWFGCKPAAVALEHSQADVEQGFAWAIGQQLGCKSYSSQRMMPFGWQLARVGSAVAGVLVCASVAVFSIYRP